MRERETALPLCDMCIHDTPTFSRRRSDSAFHEENHTQTLCCSLYRRTVLVSTFISSIWRERWRTFRRFRQSGKDWLKGRQRVSDVAGETAD